MPDEVWVLMHYDYSQTGLMGVYATAEAGMKDRPDLKWEKNGADEWVAGREHEYVLERHVVTRDVGERDG